MTRLVVIILFIGTLVGTLMPSGKPAVETDPGTTTHTLEIQSARMPEDTGRSSTSGGRVTLTRSMDGHFYADVRVNGHDIRFLVDTGATTVAFTEDDARRAGIDFDPSAYQVVGRGAAGALEGQFVRVDGMTLGRNHQSEVPAVVLSDSDESLLGQNFLRGFDSVAIEDDKMVLR